MKKIYLLIAFMFVCCSYLKAQATSLVVDCQNPGWLSNKIAYGDQKTIKDLKVTGYINADDLKFIGEMMSKQSLKGCIDLEDVNIVGATLDEDDVMPQNAFNIDWSEYNPAGIHVSEIIFPLSITKSTSCLSPYICVDKITIGSELMPSVNGETFYDNIYSEGDGIRFNGRVKHLVLREGVTEIPERAFYNKPYNSSGASKEECRFESVTFPSTLKSIGKGAFCCCYNLSNIQLPDSLEELADEAFYKTAYTPDTLYLPKNLKKLHTRAFNLPKPKVIYIDSAIEIIDNRYYTYNSSYNMYYENNFITASSNKEIHLNKQTPPNFLHYGNNCLSGSTIYVPKSSVSEYQQADVWKYATILPEPIPATSIEIDLDSVELVKGKTKQLSATVLPTDADSIYYSWSSSNSEIVSVSSTGLITANSSGEAFVIATLNADSTIIDSCKVKVFQPVTSVALNTKEKTLSVGDTYTLIVTVNPNDADNKNIIWTSENPEIATIEDGTIKALKAGVAKITAISEDNNNATDYCEVTVTQPTTGIILNHSEYKLEGIGETIQIEATVMPEDATNKDVNWKSSNENVCIVSNGKVVAVGYGTCIIIATTIDGGYMAICTINVVDTTGIESVTSNEKEYHIYTIDGKQVKNITRGIYIFKSSDGTRKKVYLK